MGAPPARLGARRLRGDELRASVVVWGVVNAVCLLQAAGFAARPFAPQVNHVLGFGIIAAAVPATYALLVFLRARSGALLSSGPLVFDLFVALMIGVDYVVDLEWRDPARPLVQIPYLALFFIAIVLMGLPMFGIDRRRWSVTAVSAAALLAAMAFALWRGVA